MAFPASMEFGAKIRNRHLATGESGPTNPLDTCYHVGFIPVREEEVHVPLLLRTRSVSCLKARLHGGYIMGWSLGITEELAIHQSSIAQHTVLKRNLYTC